MLAFFLNIMLVTAMGPGVWFDPPPHLVQGCGYPDRVLPLHPPCTDGEHGEPSTPTSGCTVLWLGADGWTRVQGWDLSALPTIPPGGGPLMVVNGATEEDQTCNCLLWEYYPAYVIWEHGNPCVKGVV